MFRLVSGPHFDADASRAMGQEAFDRSYRPDGVARQTMAIAASPDRTPDLRRVRVPALVIHGLVDPLVMPSGGIATAEAIPGAKLVMYPDMGHDLPRAALGRHHRGDRRQCTARGWSRSDTVMYASAGRSSQLIARDRPHGDARGVRGLVGAGLPQRGPEQHQLEGDDAGQRQVLRPDHRTCRQRHRGRAADRRRDGAQVPGAIEAASRRRGRGARGVGGDRGPLGGVESQGGGPRGGGPSPAAGR